MDNKKNVILIVIGIIVLLLLFFGGWYFLIRPDSVSNQKGTADGELIDLGNNIKLQKNEAKYKIASGKTSGFFKNGQPADIMLSGIDFNNTGGPLLFNHLGGIASDGKHLILADRNNNRVLIWNKIPSKNEEPDLVLGQKDFITNNPGQGLDGLNWPVAVATDGIHLIVADTYNDRILIWNSFPAKNAQPADFEIKGVRGQNTKSEVIWPWAVWTNGEKMVVASTGASKVLIWNSIPNQNNQEADIVLALKDAFGTPRSIGSDGKHLIIGDHNARVNGKKGNFFWNTFPTKDDQNYDFFMADVPQQNQQLPNSQNGSPGPVPTGEDGKPLPPPNNSQNQQVKGVQDGQPQQSLQPQGQSSGLPGEIFWSPIFTKDGKLVILTNSISIWNSYPTDENDQPDLTIGGTSGPQTQGSKNGYKFIAGDGSGMVLVSDKLFLSLSNGNKIIVYNSIPTQQSQEPDFAIGSSDIDTDTLETSFIISNPTPTSNGKSLFVSSDFDRKLYVWKNLPDESGAKPDFVYYLPEGPWDNELYNDKLVLAGGKTVYIWDKLPLNGEAPNTILSEKIGNVTLSEIKGMAMDKKYFYLAEPNANKIYVWEGIPKQNSNPKFTLSTSQPWRLSSDGNYLVVTSTLNNSESIKVYKIDQLSNDAKPKVIGGPGSFNLPQGANIIKGQLFVGDTTFNRVVIWKNIETALNGQDPDVVLGYTGNVRDELDNKPQIGQNKLFWPAVPYFDGKYLWVGEFKFSERILRFSPSD